MLFTPFDDGMFIAVCTHSAAVAVSTYSCGALCAFGLENKRVGEVNSLWAAGANVNMPMYTCNEHTKHHTLIE